MLAQWEKGLFRIRSGPYLGGFLPSALSGFCPGGTKKKGEDHEGKKKVGFSLCSNCPMCFNFGGTGGTYSTETRLAA